MVKSTLQTYYNSLIEAVKNENDSNENRPSNPFDEYLGEEIIKMDDLRGMAMTASDWLQPST